MKINKKVLILSLCLIVCLICVTTLVPIVGADSGFDGSYDSGGSSFGGSDFGGSSSGSDSDGSAIFYLIYLCIEYPPLGIAVLIILGIIYFSNKKKGEKIIKDSLNSKLELLDVNKFPNEKQLEIEAFNLYKQIQFAWMNFDYEKIRNCTTDEMYNMYLMQLDTLKVKNQKNIMYDIKYLGSSIKEMYEENGQETIVINMQVSCYDFIIDTKTNKVVRGNSHKLNIYNYKLTFVRTKENKDLDICPQCGAPVEGNNSGVCEYCRSTLISNNYTLVMSKKKMISQK